MESSWNFIENGMFLEAINAATEEYNSSNSLISLRHRAMASMMINNYKDALNDYLKVFDETEDCHKGDSDYIDIGVAFWLLGEYTKAAQMFRDSMVLKLPYTANIIIPPAIVYFASAYLKDETMKKESIKYLRKHAKKKLPLALFLLGEINDTQLLETLKEDSPIRSRVACKYELYIAAKYLESGDKIEFYNHLKRSLDTKEIIEFEYFIALSELKKRHEA